MPNGPVRRAQLIAPFGVASMLMTKDGISLIAAGLDHWFKRATGNTGIDVDEFVIQEWRLEERLRVDHFCTPPDFRRPFRGQQTPNALLTVPFLRFPQWHFCASCRALANIPLERPGKRAICEECHNKTKKKRFLSQVPFVAICEAGHIQDFPWREWVHRTATTRCVATMRLRALGGASLAAQQLSCDCGTVSPRSLSGITTAFPTGETELSNRLDSGGSLFLCSGQTPWLGNSPPRGCGQPLRGSLRGAGNVYYSQVASSIYLPRESSSVPTRIIELLMRPAAASLIRLLEEAATPAVLRKRLAAELEPFSDRDVARALELINAGKHTNTQDDAEDELADEVAFRRREFEVLRADRTEDDLVIRSVGLEAFASLRHRFTSITLVERLRETRVFTGFSRVFAENGQALRARKAMLWREQPKGRSSWLPAYAVYGEGIFLELSETAVREWECRTGVQRRFTPLVRQFELVKTQRHLKDRELSPRFIMLHTVAHVLMNRLTFECGYSTAALRERIYCSTASEAPMAGILIYTADGDADGTMGGLVRMGNPKYLEPILRRAFETAAWCSADPVCMEAGGRGGQGPDGLNLAACHSCALVPETACEEFNRFLDRGMVVGDADSADIGFFAPLVVDAARS